MKGTHSRKLMSNTLIIIDNIPLDSINCKLKAHVQCAHVFFSPYSRTHMYMLKF